MGVDMAIDNLVKNAPSIAIEAHDYNDPLYQAISWGRGKVTSTQWLLETTCGKCERLA